MRNRIAFFGFEQLPLDGGQDGVEVHGHHPRPDRLQESELEELELRSSPASIRNGLPSTINWVAVPCLRRWGMAEEGPVVL
jgi:hypothetical protein